jgi:tetratricopeptide (TPR) repeat protein
MKLLSWPFLVSMWLLPVVASVAASPVTVTEVDEMIPTYLSGPPDPNPMFYFGRGSQGAEGRVYPYPLYNNLTNRKADQSYHLVYLENEYVKIGIAPGIGGRLFSALDKTNNYDFIYHQHVIKPALIGLIGAWISGGIEWNIPHHHRASTFLPVQYRTEENADGSKTVWVGELEVRQRMRWAVGYTLSPGSSVLKCSVRIVNRTPLENTMLCFANVAVSANENYQIIFPPDTQWVTHHLKRQFTQWPNAQLPYGGVDWDHVDVSWYKNHERPNSMFAWNYWDDFYAGYDHGRQAGTMSIANHHVVPGKKFWTWGNGPRGKMWDGILTDNDGPYIELMVGAYSDNQPDYSWLQPYETRAFEMNWYPFRDIDGVKNANLEAAVNVEVKDGIVHYGFYTTRAHAKAVARLTFADRTAVEETITIDPAHPYRKQLELPAGLDAHAVRAALLVDGHELVAYTPLKLTPMAMPEPVKPPLAPAEFKTDEELALTAQRIDQFHDPERAPEPWWEETLRRDPGDSAAHLGLGLRALRSARYGEAEQHFRAALTRLTARHTTPKNAEPFYYLGVALRGEGRNDEAYDAFFKAAWSQEWKGPAYQALAEIATGRGDFVAALDLVNQALDANALNVRAYGLKSALLRHLGRGEEARRALEDGRQKSDPLDVFLMAEQWLLHKQPEAEQRLFATLNAHGATAQELAAEYAGANLWSDGIEVLARAVGQPGAAQDSPVLYYYLADFAEKLHQADAATNYRKVAAQKLPDYVFPFQAELIPVLRRAVEASPTDARAPYYLGNLLFDWQPAESVALWEKSAALDPTFAIVWRNLAQAYAHSKKDDGLNRAIAALEKAVALPNSQPTHLAELDSLYAIAKFPPAKRLARLEAHQSGLLAHDEALAHLIGLKIFAGQAGEAIDLLAGHTFNIWEGGTRFDTGESWIDAHVARGRQRFAEKKYREALADFEAAVKFPINLRAYDQGLRTAEISYWVGCAWEALGDSTQATAAWNRAASSKYTFDLRNSDVEMTTEAFRRSAQRNYQALAMSKLLRHDEAWAIFHELAGSGPATEASALYTAGLGDTGLGNPDKARTELLAAQTLMPDNLEVLLALERL